MKKILFTLLCLLCFNLPVKADTLVTDKGTILDCKILHVVGGMISIKTENGEYKFVRTLPQERRQDIVLVGFFKKQEIKGNITYLDDTNLRIKSDNSIYEINRFRVRDIKLFSN